MLRYCEMNLDRASNFRKDNTWLETKKNNNSRWLVMFDDKNLFCDDKNEPIFLSFDELSSLNMDALENAIFLGSIRHTSSVSENRQCQKCPSRYPKKSGTIRGWLIFVLEIQLTPKRRKHSAQNT